MISRERRTEALSACLGPANQPDRLGPSSRSPWARPASRLSCKSAPSRSPRRVVASCRPLPSPSSPVPHTSLPCCHMPATHACGAGSRPRPRLKLRWHKRNLSALIAFEAELRGQSKALNYSNPIRGCKLQGASCLQLQGASHAHAQSSPTYLRCLQAYKLQIKTESFVCLTKPTLT